MNTGELTFPGHAPGKGAVALRAGRALRTLALAVTTLAIAALLLWNVALGYVMVTRLHMNDFGKFYHSTVAFLRGDDMYGPGPATWIPVGDENRPFWNMNPPHFHLLLLPLAILPSAGALVLWSAANLLALGLSLRLIARQIRSPWSPWGRRLSVVGLLAFAGTGAVCVTGQLAWLLLLPVTAVWLEARRGHWAKAGLYLGLAMAVKPFMLLVWVYLIRRGALRAAALAAAVAAGWLAVGLLVFGPESYRSWLGALAAVDWEWAGMNGSIAGIVTRAFQESPYYSPLALAPWLVQPAWLGVAGAVGMLTLMGTRADKTPEAVDRRFALLLVATQLISPLGWVYYLWLALGPLGARAASCWRRDARSRAVAGARSLMLLAGFALIYPVPATLLGQPNAWATLTLGSAYFWGMLALWVSVLITVPAPLTSSRGPE